MYIKSSLSVRFLTPWGVLIRLANVAIINVEIDALAGGHVHDHVTAIVVGSDHDGALATTSGRSDRDCNRARCILKLDIQITEVRSSIQEVRKNGASLILREVERLNSKVFDVRSALRLSPYTEQLLSVVCVDSTNVVDGHVREEDVVVHQVS